MPHEHIENIGHSDINDKRPLGACPGTQYAAQAFGEDGIPKGTGPFESHQERHLILEVSGKRKELSERMETAPNLGTARGHSVQKQRFILLKDIMPHPIGHAGAA